MSVGKRELNNFQDQESAELQATISEVSNQLRQDCSELWSQAPSYGVYDEDLQVQKLSSIYETLHRVTNNPAITEDAGRTAEFISLAHKNYHRGSEIGQDGEFAFLVPTRIERSSENYGSEIFPFLPLLQYVDGDIRQRFVADLPPCVIETYGRNENGNRGYLVFTPLLIDMEKDLGGKVRAYTAAKAVINDAARFAHGKLGANVLGLGATIPALTRFGKRIEEDVITTSGHGGTVHLISETVKSLAEKDYDTATIGVIGAAGAIGSSSLDVLAEQFADSSFMLYDIEETRLERLSEHYNGAGHRTAMAADNREVLEKSDIIVSAVTETIDLDEQMPDIDLSGKVIVDDSQPGCFNRDQVEARGGKLVWVVGKDTTNSDLLTRSNGYNYGTEVGLISSQDIWGCEAEAAAIALTGEYDKAVRSQVSPQIAREIGVLLTEIGVETAAPQSFGRPVDL